MGVQIHLDAMRGVKANRGAKGEQVMKTKTTLKMNLQLFAEGDEQTPPSFGFEDFKAFAESNEDAQKFLQSQSQSVADKQLESWKANNLDKIKQDTIKSYEESKKNKSPEQIELEKLRADIESEKSLRVKSENLAYVSKEISGIKLDDDLKPVVSEFMLNNLVSSDTEFTQNGVAAFTSVIEAIQEKHAETIKSMEMTNAFGNKNQQQQTNKTNEPMKNPNEALRASIGKLIGE